MLSYLYFYSILRFRLNLYRENVLDKKKILCYSNPYNPTYEP
jgi:hypothetical protein